MTYLIMCLDAVFVIDIIAFIDHLHFVTEARKLALDLMPGALAADLAVTN